MGLGFDVNMFYPFDGDFIKSIPKDISQFPRTKSTIFFKESHFI